MNVYGKNILKRGRRCVVVQYLLVYTMIVGSNRGSELLKFPCSDEKTKHGIAFCYLTRNGKISEKLGRKWRTE